MSRVSAMVWQMAQNTPLLPESVLRSWLSRVAKAMPVPSSAVGLKLSSSRPCSSPEGSSGPTV